jgi:hypothetical protein
MVTCLSVVSTEGLAKLEICLCLSHTHVRTQIDISKAVAADVIQSIKVEAPR